MVHHLSEHPVSNQDLDEILEFVHAMWRAEETPVAPAPSAVRSHWFDQGRLQQWRDADGARVGVAHRYVDSAGVIHLETAMHSEHREMVLFESMLAWALDASARDRGEASSTPSLIRVVVPESDVSLPFCLLRLGFEADSEMTESVWSRPASPEKEFESVSDILVSAHGDAERLDRWMQTAQADAVEATRWVVVCAAPVEGTPVIDTLRSAGFERIDTWQTYAATASGEAVRHSTEGA